MRPIATDVAAVWGQTCVPKTIMKWGAHWRHLANTIKRTEYSWTPDSAPGAATRGVTLSARPVRVAIYYGTLCANMT